MTTKTTMRRSEQHRDRWSSYGASTGIREISDRLSVADLRQIEILDDYDDRFLERISPDISLVTWSEGAVLFEEGAYLDLAFFVVEGTVDVFVQKVRAETGGAEPIFDVNRTGIIPAVAPRDTEDPGDDAGQATVLFNAASSRKPSAPPMATEHSITLLATMDFNLPRGGKSELGPGEVFGEIGAMSGWPQSVTARTATECKLLQIRVPALRLMKRKSRALKARLDAIYRDRALMAQLKSTPLFRHANELFLKGIQEVVELVSLEPGEVLARENEAADALYLVRSGFMRLTQSFGEGDVVVSYLGKGETLGEIEALIDGIEGWQATASSVEYAELVRLPKVAFEGLLQQHPDLEEQAWQNAAARLREMGFSRRNLDHSEFTEIALDQGLVQGNSILVIDLAQCTRCDDCVRACASTHGGRPRFVREGDRVGELLIAKSCYHCRDPVCLVGCPTGAIHRVGVGAVVGIDETLCIGCSACANNCPYDSIQMHPTGTTWPDDMVPAGLRNTPRNVASKCDLCHTTGHDPACVSNCPQGCAFRVGSPAEFREVLGRE